MQPAPAQREFAFSQADFRFITDLVAEKTGIVLAEHKQDMVYARIARRLRSLKLNSFSDYCALLKCADNDDELVNFVNAITTNMTSFYREAHHFEHLRDVVLRPLVKSPPPAKRVRLWSAACSNGSEPYSMALTCLEAIPDIDQWDVKILATDIDTNMLAKGSAGLYPEPDAEPVPPALRQRYLMPAGGGQVQVHERARKLISFKPLNLIGEWPFKGPFDAVFCRNVVIYFDKDTQRTLFGRMADYVKPGHWLYIGHSESLHNISDRFELRGKTTYQRAP